jgi:hypothetical protein
MAELIRRSSFFIACSMIALALQLWNLQGFAFINPMSDCDLRDSPDDDAIGSYLPQHRLHLSNETLTSRNKMNLTQSNVAIFVLSRRYGGLEVRNAIRETWAKGHDNVYFVIGQDCRIPPQYRDRDEGGNEACQVAPQPLVPKRYSKLTKEHHAFIDKTSVEVMNELETHRDLLITDVIDVYRTLPQKIKAAYAFVEQSLPNVQWIVKVDDDFFVRVDKFSEYLQANFNAEDSILVGGKIKRENKAHIAGKWKEVPQFPLGAEYPPFPLGSSGHAVSRPIAKWVVKNQEVLFDYQGEDVSLGIWLEQKRRVKLVDSNVMSNQRECFDRSKFVVGHNINPQMMKNCYE